MGMRNFLDKLKKKVEPGSKFHFLYATFEALDTFLYVPDKVSVKGSHIRDAVDLKRVMTAVIIALIPPLLFGIWNIGYQHYIVLGIDTNFWQNFLYGLTKFLPIMIVSYLAGGLVEVIFAQIKHEEVSEGYLITGLLIPLVIPVETPLWMVALAAIFATLFGKEVFGGTGYNIFNPALLARAFLFFAYPKWMSGDKVWIADLPDAVSGATPLAHLTQASSVEQIQAVHANFSIADLFFGFVPGSIGETSTLAILIGALILIYTGVGSWKIIVSAFVGAGVMGIILNIFATPNNPFMTIPFWEHWFLGGFAFGMVYMATDPVSSSHTELGKWIYGFLAGFMAILIRVLNPAYPEGVMLAILLLNMFAPLIDYLVVNSHIKKRLKRAELLNSKNL